MLTQRGKHLKKVVSITTDGAPSMMGQEKEHYGSVMNTITKLVNSEGFIISPASSAEGILSTKHSNDLNLKLQGKDSSECDLVAAVQSFQKKLVILKMDLKED
ncbi:hypothetical protein WMY93_031536 [Mugilogobius chulae]|uniref:VWFA domain-containing protein n=1 Tax=Mugilogobius chulae TaxID=88201 RepID=A0AAW0MG05_9GOBI